MCNCNNQLSELDLSKYIKLPSVGVEAKPSEDLTGVIIAGALILAVGAAITAAILSAR